MGSPVKCTTCGTEEVFLAQRQKQDGSYGWAMFNKTPGGPLKSFSISEKDRVKVALFALNKDQRPGVDYYTMHYNTKTKGCNPNDGSATPAASRPAVAISGDLHAVITVGGKTYEGQFTERAF